MLEDEEQFGSQHRMMHSGKHKNREVIPIALLTDCPRILQAQTFQKTKNVLSDNRKHKKSDRKWLNQSFVVI